jgi:hypothetical protein
MPFASNLEDLGQKADKNRMEKELFLLKTVRWLSLLSTILYWANRKLKHGMGAEVEPPSSFKISAEARFDCAIGAQIGPLESKWWGARFGPH